MKEEKIGTFFTPQKFKSTYSSRIIFYKFERGKKGTFFTPKKFKSTYSSRIIIYKFERGKKKEHSLLPKNSNLPIVLESYSINLKEEKKREHSLLPKNSNPYSIKDQF